MTMTNNIDEILFEINEQILNYNLYDKNKLSELKYKVESYTKKINDVNKQIIKYTNILDNEYDKLLSVDNKIDSLLNLPEINKKNILLLKNKLDNNIKIKKKIDLKLKKTKKKMSKNIKIMNKIKIFFLNNLTKLKLNKLINYWILFKKKIINNKILNIFIKIFTLL